MLPSITVMLLTVSSMSISRQQTHNSYISSTIPENGSVYDYVIVGAGSAGAVLAGRLAENSAVSVLLLESGGPQSVVTDMPGNTLALVGGEFDWNYSVVPQRDAGRAYPRFGVPRGRVLGGSSTTNWDIYNRGNPRDFDSWATDFGLTNLTWVNVREYFLLSENNTDANIRLNGAHNVGGSVSVSTETMPDRVLLEFMNRMNKVGLPTIDINGDSQDGTAIAQMFWNSDTGIKSTTANVYLERGNRTNLTILTRATVLDLLITGTQAQGVRYRDRNGEIRTVNARQEVILSAGPINTPQILINSGIGPADHLRQLGVSLVRDLPVGDNLHDMVFVPLYYRINDPSLVYPFPDFSTENLYEYYVKQQGPLAHHADGVTYHATPGNSRDWPNTMIISVVEFFNDLNGTVSQYARNQPAWRRFWQEYQSLGYYLALDPVLARPTSRGTVRLNPADRYRMPLIDPQYLSTTDDFEAMVEVSQFVVDTMARFPIEGVVEFPAIPDCRACFDGKTRCSEYVRCYVRQMARSYYNFVGTARMGALNSTDAVVDPNFRVMGVDNLRVVDASVIPRTPNAHTNAVTIVLAEKAARLLMTGQ